MTKPKTAVPVTEQEQPELKVEVNKAVVKGSISAELTKQFNNFQNLINLANSIKFTPDNLQTEGEVLKTVRSSIAQIDKLRERLKKPYFEAGKTIDAAAKELIEPLKEVLDRKTEEYRVVVDKVRIEQDRINRENQRIASIKEKINDFILTKSQQIAAATKASEIEAIEKEIAEEKKNKIRYEEFLDDLKERASELLPIIKSQRKHIEKLEELEKQKKKAEKKGDDAAMLKIMSKQDDLNEKIETGKVEIQEAAVSQAVKGGTTTAEVIPTNVPNARRTTWKCEIKDVSEAFKKSPHLLEVSLNSKAVSDSIKTLKESGVFDGKTEVTIGGLRYWEDKMY